MPIQDFTVEISTHVHPTGVTFNYKDPKNYHFWDMGGATNTLYRVLNGTLTNLGDLNGNGGVASYRVVFDLDTGAFQGYRNSTLVRSTTLTPIAGGIAYGLHAGTGNRRFGSITSTDGTNITFDTDGPLTAPWSSPDGSKWAASGGAAYQTADATGDAINIGHAVIGLPIWTLSYELHGDCNNSGGYTTFFNLLNGFTLQKARSPVDSGHVAGECLWGPYTADVSGIFNPTIDNNLAIGYTGEGGDYGHLRRLRIEGGNGDVYYGEYPKGFPYTHEQYTSGTMDGAQTTQMGDGDYPPQQWDQQLQAYIQNPKDPNGTPTTDRGWFYFTIKYEPKTRILSVSQRKPPSQRNQAYGVLRHTRALQTMVPGTREGRVANASPLDTGAVMRISGGAAGAASATEVRFGYERFPASGTFTTAPVTLSLAHTPIQHSLYVYLNAMYLDEGFDYTISGKTITPTGGVIAAGDILEVRYAYYPATL